MEIREAIKYLKEMEVRTINSNSEEAVKYNSNIQMAINMAINALIKSTEK